MRKRTLTLSLCCMVVLLSDFCCACSSMSDGQERAADGHAQNRLMQYMEAVEYPMDDLIILLGADGDTCDFQKLCADGCLALYIDRAHCTSCWRKDVEVMQVLPDMPGIAKSLVIIASGFGSRELKIVRRDTGLRVYGAETPEALPRALTKFALPFFFALTPDGKVVLPYYPDNDDDEEFLRNYLSLVENRLEKTQLVPWPGSTGRHDTLVVENADLDLGIVGQRRKVSGKFEIRNEGRRDCVIQQIYPTCSCVLIDEYPKVIKAGETGVIRFTTVQENKGSFRHGIQVHTDMSCEPCSLTFYGECK